MLIRKHFKSFDWVLVFTSLLLVGIGLISMYSSSIASRDFSNFEKQIVFLCVGIFCMFAISLFDWRLLRNDPYLLLLLYVAGVVALVGLLLFVPSIRGVKAWYRIGEVSFDPIEYIKIVLIILSAKYFSLRHAEVYRIRHIILSGIYFFIPFLLVARQPNLGSAAVLLILWSVILLVAGIRMRHFFALITIAIVGLSIGWMFLLHDYQRDRIVAFIEPEVDPLGIGWSQEQAKIAVGNGGIFGKGIGQGTQTQYGFLSEPQTDFIFSAIAEELGFLGIILLFVFFLVFLWRVLRIGIQSPSNFARLFAAGFATLFIVQFFINIGMNLGFLPIVGLSLPLVSYGGSSLIMGYIGIGILQSIKTH